MSEHKKPLREPRYLVFMKFLVDKGDGEGLEALESQICHVYCDLIFYKSDLETEAQLLPTLLRHLETIPLPKITKNVIICVGVLIYSLLICAMHNAYATKSCFHK